MILATDVHYTAEGSTAAGVAFEEWGSSQETHSFVSRLSTAADYRPGHFYERELPCILHLLQESGAHPDIILIDGYVYLDGHARPGLGKHLFDALGGRTKVVGIAKTPFHGIGPECEVLRGTSAKPLYVTCAGEDLACAKAGVQSMYGSHRIPAMLKRADQLCRGIARVAAPAESRRAGPLRLTGD